MTSAIRVGTAPDSWGVWFPDDSRQTPYTRFLDEVVASGYTWIELGPYGYLPTDPEQLRDELGSRGLKMGFSSPIMMLRLFQSSSIEAVRTRIAELVAPAKKSM